VPARHDEPAYCALFNSETVGGNDWISGEDGDDRIEGGLGDDIIYGGYGADNTAGETGNDVIFAIDNRVDTIVCGTGSDVVTSDRNDIVARDCEVRLSPRR
jgi:Ca2+-binding RTX toxin-like protein